MPQSTTPVHDHTVPLHLQERFPPDRRAANRRTCSKRAWRTSREHRAEVYDRDGGCVWCGADEDLSLDHIVPVAVIICLPYPEWPPYLGPANLRTLCRPCHDLRNAEHLATERPATVAQARRAAAAMIELHRLSLAA